MPEEWSVQSPQPFSPGRPDPPTHHIRPHERGNRPVARHRRRNREGASAEDAQEHQAARQDGCSGLGAEGWGGGGGRPGQPISKTVSEIQVERTREPCRGRPRLQSSRGGRPGGGDPV